MSSPVARALGLCVAAGLFLSPAHADTLADAVRKVADGIDKNLNGPERKVTLVEVTDVGEQPTTLVTMTPIRRALTAQLRALNIDVGREGSGRVFVEFRELNEESTERPTVELLVRVEEKGKAPFQFGARFEPSPAPKEGDKLPGTAPPAIPKVSPPPPVPKESPPTPREEPPAPASPAPKPKDPTTTAPPAPTPREEPPPIQPAPKPSVGVTILRVKPCSPAEYAGLEVGDVIRMVNNVPITSSDQLGELLDTLRGKCVPIVIGRGERKMRGAVCLPQDGPALGVTVEQVPTAKELRTGPVQPGRPKS